MNPSIAGGHKCVKVCPACLVSDIPATNVMCRSKEPRCAQCSSYLAILDNWLMRFPRDQILFEYFEELARDPQDLLFRMFKFLGAESSKQHMAHIADRPVNAKRKLICRRPVDTSLPDSTNRKWKSSKKCLHLFPNVGIGTASTCSIRATRGSASPGRVELVRSEWHDYRPRARPRALPPTTWDEHELSALSPRCWRGIPWP